MKELPYSIIFSFLILVFSCKNEIPENKESIQKTEKDIELEFIKSKISTLKGFSKYHYAEVNIIDEENNESIITIYNKLDNKKILAVNSNSHVMELQLEDIDSLGYQQIVLFQDFNFDGFEDFALQTDYSSKGPSYSIFLDEDGKYILNEEFTCIIQNSQGNFDLDEYSNTISTRGNGGCCWHSFSEYVVADGKPKLMSKTIEERDSEITTETTTKWENGKYNENIIQYIDLKSEDINLIMSFDLQNSKKRVVLYEGYEFLKYALIHNYDIVEFHFPINQDYKTPDFGISSSLNINELFFTNKEAEYKLYQKKQNEKISEVGIIVKKNGKVFDLKGDLSSLMGEIKSSEIVKLDNVLDKNQPLKP